MWSHRHLKFNLLNIGNHVELYPRPLHTLATPLVCMIIMLTVGEVISSFKDWIRPWRGKDPHVWRSLWFLNIIREKERGLKWQENPNTLGRTRTHFDKRKITIRFIDSNLANIGLSAVASSFFGHHGLQYAWALTSSILYTLSTWIKRLHAQECSWWLIRCLWCQVLTISPARLLSTLYGERLCGTENRHGLAYHNPMIDETSSWF